MLNLPNFLTLLRILAVPVFLISLSEGSHGVALAVFVGAGLTDAADGAIARLTDSRTTLGAYMDPLADKLLVLSTFVVLAIMGLIPSWLTVVVVSRDVVILVGYLSLFLLTGDQMEIRPSRSSKLTTFLQLSTLTVVLVLLWRPESVDGGFLTALVAATGVATAVSGFQYVLRGLRWYQAHGA